MNRGTPMRIGIDVGGTHTDAALVDGERVVATAKTPTTAGVSEGIATALRTVLVETDPATVEAVMIGTTHFTNAVIEGAHLEETACVRLGLPATASLPPMVDWPNGLREQVGNHRFLARGGYEFDGREISPLDEQEIQGVAARIRDRGITAVAVCSVFSPVDPTFEQRAAAILEEGVPGATVTRSHEIGRIGLLERENAAILNASLGSLARRTMAGFEVALSRSGISAPLYVTQNDGTLMSAEFATAFPILTFASGATNSMRGAAFLAGREDAIVVDVGGTTTDVGALRRGYPRPAGRAVSIGGVRTDFRMPDTLSVGLGGGSVVGLDPLEVGPRSVGYRLNSEALVFGGDTLTATDVAVAAGRAEIGDPAQVGHLDRALVGRILERIDRTIEGAVDRMKTSAAPVPVVLVGGGSVLVGGEIAGAAETIRPEHHAVANAIGAAIARVGGACDRVFSLAETSRERALDAARTEAADRAVAAGAAPNTVEILDLDEIPLAYLPGSAVRITARAVGDLRAVPPPARRAEVGS